MTGPPEITQKKRPCPCGTEAAYKAHRRRGETPCDWRVEGRKARRRVDRFRADVTQLEQHLGRLEYERADLSLQLTDALATIRDLQLTLTNVGRVWRTPDNTLIVQAKDSDGDPSGCFPKGTVELLAATESAA